MQNSVDNGTNYIALNCYSFNMYVISAIRDLHDCFIAGGDEKSSLIMPLGHESSTYALKKV